MGKQIKPNFLKLFKFVRNFKKLYLVYMAV